jgi:hypothetical protein
MTFKNWFETFLDEKALPFKSWEIQVDGEIHFIDSDVVIEAILNAPEHEQKAIKEMIVKIDFVNGNVNDYFKHLATGLIVTRKAA